MKDEEGGKKYRFFLGVSLNFSLVSLKLRICRIIREWKCTYESFRCFFFSLSYCIYYLSILCRIHIYMTLCETIEP